MEMNLLGNYYRNADDLFRELLRIKPIKYSIFHVPGTKQGIVIEHPIHGKPNTNSNGFYIIYKYDVPIYVGQCSGMNTIHTRISRFVKTLLGNNTEKEDHPAASQFMGIYGNSLAGLSVMIFPVESEQFDEIDGDKVETRFIQEFKPRFNMKGQNFHRRSTCYKETKKKCNAAIKSVTKGATAHIASLEKFLE